MLILRGLCNNCCNATVARFCKREVQSFTLKREAGPYNSLKILLMKVRSKIIARLDQLPSLWLPLALIIVYILVSLLIRNVLPSLEEILDGFTNLFAKYGYEIVFIGAFLEAALLVDLFIPGGSIVLVGAYFSSTGLLSYPLFLAVTTLGFFLGFTLDFLLGYFGWSDILEKFGLGKQLEQARVRIKKWEGKAFLLGYIHPDSASLIAAAAGTIRMDIRRFTIYNLFASLVWLLIWTGLVYLFGQTIVRLFEGQIAYLGIIIVLVFLVLSWIGMGKVKEKG